MFASIRNVNPMRRKFGDLQIDIFVGAILYKKLSSENLDFSPILEIVWRGLNNGYLSFLNLETLQVYPPKLVCTQSSSRLVPATDRCSNGFCKVHLRIRTFNLWASLLSNRLFFLPLPLTFHVRFWSCMVGGNINYIQIEEMEKHVRKSYSRPFFL